MSFSMYSKLIQINYSTFSVHYQNKSEYTNDTMFYYYRDLDVNLAWLIEETEGKKSNNEIIN